MNSRSAVRLFGPDGRPIARPAEAVVPVVSGAPVAKVAAKATAKAAAASEQLGVPAPKEADRRTLTRAVETRALRGFLGVLAMLPDPDEIAQREGPDIYDRMRSDDAVFAAEFQLQTRILGRPWDVRPPEHLAGDRFAVDVAEYVKGVLTAMNADTMIGHLYRALRYKHAGGQLVYREDGSTLVPSVFLPERREVFRFGEHGSRFVNTDGVWREVDPFKWVTHVNEAEPERPTGRSIFSRVYYPWRFKRTGWELWLTAMQRFAVPSLAALFEMAEDDAGKMKEIADALAEELLNIASGSVGALGQTKTLAQIGGAKAVEGFDTFMEMCDRSIYRGLLTVTLTVSEGRQGADRGNTEVHDEAADQVAEYYARQMAESVTRQVCAYAALMKYGERARAVLPRFEFDFEEPISHERLVKFMELGVPVSIGALYSRRGVPKPVDDSDSFISPKLSGAAGPQPGGANLTAAAELAAQAFVSALATALQASGSTLSVGQAAPPALAPVAPPVARLQRDVERKVIEVPVAGEEDEAEVRRRLYTFFRDQQICAAFDALREGGATWDEAANTLAADPRWGLSQSRIKNVVIERRKERGGDDASDES